MSSTRHIESLLVRISIPPRVYVTDILRQMRDHVHRHGPSHLSCRMLTRLWNGISLDSIRTIIRRTTCVTVCDQESTRPVETRKQRCDNEFIGLRANMYAVRVDGKMDTKKVKVVKNNIAMRNITFDDYMRCLNEEIEMTCHQSCIRSKLHEVYTISELKIALSLYYNKRYTLYRIRRRRYRRGIDIPL